MDLRIRPVPADIHFLRIVPASQFPHHVFRKIDQHRPWPSGSGNVKSLLHNPPQVFPAAHRDAVLGDTAGNPHNIYLLEGVIPNQVPCHLTGKTHQRNTVIVRRRKAGHQIRRPRPAGHKAHAHFSGTSGISIRLMHQRYLLPRQDNLRIILLIQLVTDINRACARIAEQCVYPFFLQRLYQ